MGSITSTTVTWFNVSVPVLSDLIADVDPSGEKLSYEATKPQLEAALKTIHKLRQLKATLPTRELPPKLSETKATHVAAGGQ